MGQPLHCFESSLPHFFSVFLKKSELCCQEISTLPPPNRIKGFECRSSGSQYSGLGVTNLEGDKSIAFPLDLLGKQDQVFKYRFADEHSLLQKIGEFGVVAFRLNEDPEKRTYQQVGDHPFRLGDDSAGLWDEFSKAVNETGNKGDFAVADGYFTEWYEWVSGYPAAEIAGNP